MQIQPHLEGQIGTKTRYSLLHCLLHNKAPAACPPIQWHHQQCFVFTVQLMSLVKSLSLNPSHISVIAHIPSPMFRVNSTNHFFIHPWIDCPLLLISQLLLFGSLFQQTDSCQASQKDHYLPSASLPSILVQRTDHTVTSLSHLSNLHDLNLPKRLKFTKA